MKKICRTIKLKKYQTDIKEILNNMGNEDKKYYILYADSTYNYVWGVGELIKVLEQDHIHEVRCIFEEADKILIDRNIIINTDEIK